jgi:hypothetical protein
MHRRQELLALSHTHCRHAVVLPLSTFVTEANGTGGSPVPTTGSAQLATRGHYAGRRVFMARSNSQNARSERINPSGPTR